MEGGPRGSTGSSRDLLRSSGRPSEGCIDRDVCNLETAAGKQIQWQSGAAVRRPRRITDTPVSQRRRRRGAGKKEILSDFEGWPYLAVT